MTDLLRYELADSIATITLDDGKVNCFSLAMLAQLNQAIDQAEEANATVVLTGRPGMFSGGFDLATFKQGGEALYDMLKGGAELAHRIMNFPRPFVVACSGHAVAMGAFVAMSADARLGVEGDFKLVMNEVAIGMTLPRFAIEIARSRLTPTHFHRATTTAAIYAPETAVEAGFLDKVVPAEALLSEAKTLATALNQLNAKAFRDTKRLVREHALNALRDAIDRELGTFEVYQSTIAPGLGS